MSRPAEAFGIRREAVPAWVALTAVLEDMADHGQTPVCHQRPEQWSEDATEAARRDAAEACEFCPARHACAAFARANRERSGVWGGLDYSPRKNRSNAA